MVSVNDRREEGRQVGPGFVSVSLEPRTAPHCDASPEVTDAMGYVSQRVNFGAKEVRKPSGAGSVSLGSSEPHVSMGERGQLL